MIGYLKDKMIVLLYLVSLLTRFIFLFYGYPSITHDEADYFLNSYLLAKTGSDIFNQKFFLTSGILNATSSIPVYIGSFVYHFLDKSTIAGRLPYAILNSLIPVLFYLILNKLTKNKTLSLIGFIVLNFSPWFSYLSSMSAIDAPTALVLYLASVYALLKKIKPIYKNSLFLFFSFLSFNSYMGIKTIFLYLVFIALLSKDIYDKNKITFKSTALNFFYSFIIFASLLVITWNSPTNQYFQNRLKDKILLLNTNHISKTVDSLREMSLGQKHIRYLLHNKLTVGVSMFLERYIQAFSPNILFVKGDSNPLYGTGYFGLFNLFDGIFLIFGLLFAYKLFKSPLIQVPFILILITTPFAVGIMVDGATISLRGHPLIIGYSFFISVGIYYLLSKLIKKHNLFLGITASIYILGFIYFFILFKTTIRFTSGEQWHINEKNLIAKILLMEKKSNNKIFVYVNDPKETMLLYLFYKEKDAQKIKKIISSNKFVVNNISFSDKCPQEKISESIQIIHSERCPINNQIFKTKDFIYPEIPKGSKYFLLY